MIDRCSDHITCLPLQWAIVGHSVLILFEACTPLTGETDGIPLPANHHIGRTVSRAESDSDMRMRATVEQRRFEIEQVRVCARCRKTLTCSISKRRCSTVARIRMSLSDSALLTVRPMW